MSGSFQDFMRAKGKGTAVTRRRVLLSMGDGPVPIPTLRPNNELVLPAPSDTLVPLDLRPLTSGEQQDVLAKARAHAIAKGVADPQDGNPIYDLAEMEHTLLRACIVADNPDAPPRPFFASLEEMRESPELGRDRIAYLFELHQQFQDYLSPQRRTASPDEMITAILALAHEDFLAACQVYDLLSPALRWTCLRFLSLQFAGTTKASTEPVAAPESTREPAASEPVAPPPAAPAPVAPIPSQGNRSERRALAKKGKGGEAPVTSSRASSFPRAVPSKRSGLAPS